MNRIITFAQLVRLPNTFTAMADILLGALATGFLSARGSWLWNRLFAAEKSNLASFGSEAAAWFSLACLLVASTMLYWSGMIWNDYFDIDQDRRERPGRPLASGRVSLRSAWFLAVGLMAGAMLLALVAGIRVDQGEWILSWRPLVIAGFLIVAILLYDGVLKATFAGPILMGSCRFLNILLGFSIVSTVIPMQGWLIAVIIGVYVGGITWFARTETKTSSQPMLIGASVAMLIALALALTVPALAIERVPDSRQSFLFPYLLALFGSYLGIAAVAAIRRPDPRLVQPVIKRAILGLIVLDALLASAFVGTLGLLLVILLLPGMILGRWVYST